MTPEEKFKFDLEGYLLIKNVLSPGEVAALNEVADRVFPRNFDEEGEGFKGRKGLRRTSKVSAWSSETQALIDHPNAVLNGLTVLTYFLSDAKVGDGGFACVPGSHKTNCREHLPDDVIRFERIPDYVVQPEVEAGDALIFTEALVHGTMPWTAEHERRTFLYKYTPGNLVHSLNYYDQDDYTDLTEQQKRVMAPPSSGGRPNVVEEA